jgi:serine phosphatase RsbU (regulator of sigma subunit)
MEVVTIQPTTVPKVIGRASKSDIILKDPDETVSRAHAEVYCSAGAWYIKDVGSKHGTLLNAVRLMPNQPAMLRSKDRVKIGPWAFRVAIGASVDSTERLTITDDRQSTTMQVQRVVPAALGGDAQKRLDLLIECAARMSAALDEQALAGAALDTLMAATGFPRAAILRFEGAADQVQVIASRGPTSTGASATGTKLPPSASPFVKATTSAANIQFSRSLLQAAAEGEPVVLNAPGAGAMTPNYGQSIMSLGITSALCSPIMIDDEADAFIYLDARGAEPRSGVFSGSSGMVSLGSPSITPDTIAFCQAIARLCGLALANLVRVRLARDEQKRSAELEAARAVQRLIMPRNSGSHGAVTYTMFSRPGQRVAGDLFDFFAMEAEEHDQRVAFLIGDVEGKGVAAGMVMANVQAHLSRLLRNTGDPALTMCEVSRLVARYSDRQDDSGTAGGRAPMYLTLWAGVIDPVKETLTYVDAGHGHWLIRTPNGMLSKPGMATGFPVGIESHEAYINTTIPLPRASRIILYTDGVTEQRSQDGGQFGVTRAMEVLAVAAAAKDDVEKLFEAVVKHAGWTKVDADTYFNDDVTIASIAFE